MITHHINSQDRRYLFFTIDNQKEAKMLTEYLNQIPQYMFLPSYTSIPKPEVHLNFIDPNGKRIYWVWSGLYLEVLNWCREKGIQTTLTDNLFYRKPKHTLEEFRQIVDSWGLSLKPYDYQYEAAYNILSYTQSLSEIATRAGKTLIGYMVFRYLMQEEGCQKILMVVPSITLVKQGFEDFNTYAEFFKTETVWAKGESVSCPNLTIGTFQSLVKRCDKRSPKYNPHYFDGYDVVLIDEVHNAKAQSIREILSQPFMKMVKFKFGFSGTLPLKGTLDSFNVQELMGGKIQDITPKELIDGGFISDIHITQYRLKYPEMTNHYLRDEYIKAGEYLCSTFDKDKTMRPKANRDIAMVYNKTLPYNLKTLRHKIEVEQNELIKENKIIQYTDYLIDLCKANGSNLLVLENYIAHHSQKKIRLIKDIVRRSNDGNIILFFHYNEYCKYVYDILKNEFPDRHVLCMTGASTPKKREEYKKLMKENDNVVLCANYGVSSTGLTLRLKYGVFVESFKSHTIVKQSAGRGLCLDKGKDKFQLYDLIDVLPTGKIANQGRAKIKIYKQEDFKYDIIDL